MKTISRMRTPMAGRTCLLLFLGLLAGCWDSHPKQEAGDQRAVPGNGATSSNGQPSANTAKSSSAEKSAADTSGARCGVWSGR